MEWYLPGAWSHILPSQQVLAVTDQEVLLTHDQDHLHLAEGAGGGAPLTPGLTIS